MKKNLLILVLAMSLGLSDVQAANYSVTASGSNMAGKGACEYPIVSVNCKNNDDKYYHTGAGETFTLKNGAETLSGYCIDPGVNVPTNIEFKEVSNSAIAEHIEPLKMICQKTEGNEVLRIALIKAYSVNNGLGRVGGSSKTNLEEAYKGLFTKPPKTVFNSKYGDGLTILKNAMELKGDAASGSDQVYFTEQNGKLILTTNVPGKIEFQTSDKYDVYINNVKKTEAVEKTDNTLVKYTIELKNAKCEGSETEVSANVKFSYLKEDLVGTSSSNYDIGYFVNANGSSSNYQRLITCEKLEEGENPNCVGNDCEISGKAKSKCTGGGGEECKKPEVIDGSGECKKDGQTVIEVKETPNALDYNNEACITNLSNATTAILGNSNDYCEIYCSENYKLFLPGPDAKNSDDENMFVNAGSYFTIDDSNMYDETKFTCYGKMKFDDYKNDIYQLRRIVINKYNEYVKLKEYKRIVDNAKVVEGGCEIPAGSYIPLDMDENGKIFKASAVVLSKGETLPSCPKKVSDSDIKQSEKDLNDAISNANDGIASAEKKWNECITWDFDELNKILKEEESCNTNIDFEYQFDECGVTVEKTGVSDPKNVATKTIGNSKEAVYTGVCDITGDLSKCNTTEQIDSYNYINKTETIYANYKFDNEFTVNYETGKVNCDAKTGEEYSKVYRGFPVSIDATQMKYAYEYKYTNIGHNFDVMNSKSCSMGRFDSIIGKKNNYLCYYDVNSCEDCPVYCGDPTGESNECDPNTDCGKDCITKCVGGGCLLDPNAGFLATYRTMSLNDPFPNSVVMLSSEPAKMLALASEPASSTKKFDEAGGSNWKTDKGLDATEYITKKGENIYNEEPQYKITLTPSKINEIKKYNAEQEDKNKNGYLNGTLDCKDVAGKNYGQCISTFVHDKKWDVTINNNILDVNGNIYANQIMDGNTPFVPYDGKVKAFVGPAWK